MCPSMWKRKKLIILCAFWNLKAHSRAIPDVITALESNILLIFLVCAYLNKVSGIKILQDCWSEVEDTGPDPKRTVTSSIFNKLRLRQKWPLFCRRYCQVHFLQWISNYFDSDFTEVCFQGPNYQHASIGSDNGLVLTRRQANGLALMRRQAIIWTNDGWFTDAYMLHSASMS